MAMAAHDDLQGISGGLAKKLGGQRVKDRPRAPHGADRATVRAWRRRCECWTKGAGRRPHSHTFLPLLLLCLAVLTWKVAARMLDYYDKLYETWAKQSECLERIDVDCQNLGFCFPRCRAPTPWAVQAPLRMPAPMRSWCWWPRGRHQLSDAPQSAAGRGPPASRKGTSTRFPRPRTSRALPRKRRGSFTDSPHPRIGKWCTQEPAPSQQFEGACYCDLIEFLHSRAGESEYASTLSSFARWRGASAVQRGAAGRELLGMQERGFAGQLDRRH